MSVSPTGNIFMRNHAMAGPYSGGPPRGRPKLRPPTQGTRMDVYEGQMAMSDPFICTQLGEPGAMQAVPIASPYNSPKMLTMPFMQSNYTDHGDMYAWMNGMRAKRRRHSVGMMMPQYEYYAPEEQYSSNMFMMPEMNSFVKLPVARQRSRSASKYVRSPPLTLPSYLTNEGVQGPGTTFVNNPSKTCSESQWSMEIDEVKQLFLKKFKDLNIQEVTVTQLKEFLRQFGLNCAGTKSILFERLRKISDKIENDERTKDPNAFLTLALDDIQTDEKPETEMATEGTAQESQSEDLFQDILI